MMSEAMQQTDPDQSDKMLAEFARRVVDGEKTVDVFGLDDGFVDQVIHRAYKLYTLDKYEQTEVLLRGAICLDSSRVYPHLLLGVVLLERDATDEAMEQFEQVLSIEPENAVAMAKLGETHLRIGALEDAQELLAKAEAELDEESSHHRRTSVLLDVVQKRLQESQSADNPS